MSTQQQIDDPGQWRVGDDVRIEWLDGSAVTGKAEKLEDGQLAVRIGNRSATYVLDWPGIDRTVTVTRTVEPIPEPTEWLSGVRFADGTKAGRFFAGKSAWGESGTSSWVNFTWQELLGQHGAPVAVSLPRWSDEVDGLRARVAAEATRLVSEAEVHAQFGGSGVQQATIMRAAAARLRALLAEGGKA